MVIKKSKIKTSTSEIALMDCNRRREIRVFNSESSLFEESTARCAAKSSAFITAIRLVMAKCSL